jgi:hypothetical protein
MKEGKVRPSFHQRELTRNLYLKRLTFLQTLQIPTFIDLVQLLEASLRTNLPVAQV